MRSYEVIVVGCGHAGCEAALAASRSGCKTAVITMHSSLIATMPCNPSIGGIGKSHLVSELDALGGEMAKNADYTGIQFKKLNTRRGPAVQASRIQCDKAEYSSRMKAVVMAQENLFVIQSEVTDLIIRDGMCQGVILSDGSWIQGKSVVIATGTALGGRIHIGDSVSKGAGNGADESDKLSESLMNVGFVMRRLKTGTPPRIDKSSVDYERMTEQRGDDPPPLISISGMKEYSMFHVEHSARSSVNDTAFHMEHVVAPPPWRIASVQIPTHLTHTTPDTHEIVSMNLKRSALYGGHITGTGVRYCPSLEDKVVKFSDKSSHHVFIEPEGVTSDLLYPNGISNSLPLDVQVEVVHSIPGLENAVIRRPGFAIEYDFSDPTQISPSLESKLVQGLYLAGQINGTTGYEEAAAQGFIAGVNAARKVQDKSQIVMSRQDGYIGVMIDDLVTKGTLEPYRMFTSRAERRLLLRQDNARFRMFDYARDIGIVSPDLLMETESIARQVESEIARISSKKHGGATLCQILRRPGVMYSDLPDRNDDLGCEAIRQVEIDTKYDGYIRREESEVARAKHLEMLRIPDDFDYWSVRSLRYETKEKLSRVRPMNIGQATRVPGITVADMSIISSIISRQRNQ